MDSGEPITLAAAERTLRIIGLRHGERIRKRRPSTGGDDLASGYDLATIPGNIPITKDQDPDFGYSLADIVRRYQPLARTDLQRAVVKAVLAGEVC